MYQNAFGGWIPPGSDEGTYSTPETPIWIKEREKEEAERTESGNGREKKREKEGRSKFETP